MTEKLASLYSNRRQSILKKAANVRSVKELKSWFLSVFWDDMDRHDMLALEEFFRTSGIEQHIGSELSGYDLVKSHPASAASETVA